jgi:hypothetical protein
MARCSSRRRLAFVLFLAVVAGSLVAGGEQAEQHLVGVLPVVQRLEDLVGGVAVRAGALLIAQPRPRLAGDGGSGSAMGSVRFG